MPPTSSIAPTAAAAAVAPGMPTESKKAPVPSMPLMANFSQPWAMRTTPRMTRVMSRPASRTVAGTGRSRLSTASGRVAVLVVMGVLSVSDTAHTFTHPLRVVSTRSL